MHYCITVLSKEGQDIDEQLAPFQENNMGDCPKEYLQFESKTEEERKNYEHETLDKVKLPNGKLVSEYDDCLYREVTKEEYEEKDGQSEHYMSRLFDGEQKYYIKDLERVGGQKVQIPLKELYPTFEKYMEDWAQITFDEEMQDYGYWENPNAKWDWYQIGGRWSDLLVAKDGAKGDKGERGVFDYTDTASNKYSSLKVKDIDWQHDEMKDFITYGILTPDGVWFDEENTEPYKEYRKLLNDNPNGNWDEKRKILNQAREERDKKFKEILSQADPEWTLTIVDIHM